LQKNEDQGQVSLTVDTSALSNDKFEPCISLTNIIANQASQIGNVSINLYYYGVQNAGTIGYIHYYISSSVPTSVSVAIIVGAVVGSVAGCCCILFMLLFIIIIIILIRYRKKKVNVEAVKEQEEKQNQKQNEVVQMTTNDV
jgi:uncharacterized membrane protein